jgi:hypothetical protein
MVPEWGEARRKPVSTLPRLSPSATNLLMKLLKVPLRALLAIGVVASAAAAVLNPDALLILADVGSPARAATPQQSPVSLTMEDAAVAPGARTARVIARLSRPAPQTLYFRYLTKNGDGTNEGTHYERKSGILVFQTGERAKAIDIALLRDLEPGQRLTLVGGWPYSYPATAIEKGEAKIALGEPQPSEPADSAPPRRFAPTGMKRVFYSNFIDNFCATDSGFGPGGRRCWKTKLDHGRSQPANSEVGLYADPAVVPGTDPFPVVDGKRVLRAQRLAKPVKWAGKRWNYSAAMLTTQTLWAGQYGYYELRAKLPTLPGSWPAWWGLPTDRSWPPENDHLELFNKIGSSPAEGITYTQHWIEGGQRGSYGSIAPMAAYGLGKLDDWHTYGVLITRQRYQRFIDGVLVFDQPNRVNTPMYMLINVAVGGSVIGGTPPEDAPFVADMMLDYVAVWQWPAK